MSDKWHSRRQALLALSRDERGLSLIVEEMGLVLARWEAGIANRGVAFVVARVRPGGVTAGRCTRVELDAGEVFDTSEVGEVMALSLALSRFRERLSRLKGGR